MERYDFLGLGCLPNRSMSASRAFCFDHIGAVLAVALLTRVTPRRFSANFQGSWNRNLVEIALHGLAGEGVDVGGTAGCDVSRVDHASTGESCDLGFGSETAGRDVGEHLAGGQRQDIRSPGCTGGLHAGENREINEPSAGLPSKYAIIAENQNRRASSHRESVGLHRAIAFVTGNGRPADYPTAIRGNAVQFTDLLRDQLPPSGSVLADPKTERGAAFVGMEDQLAGRPEVRHLSFGIRDFLRRRPAVG